MRNLANKTIVLIDDSEDDAFITKRMLKKHGVIVSMEHIDDPVNCAARLNDILATGVKVDELILLLDINMPVISGFDVLQMLREDETFKVLPVIMLSSSSSGGDIHKSLGSGADGYLHKPFDPDALFEALLQVSDTKNRIIPDMVKVNS